MSAAAFLDRIESMLVPSEYTKTITQDIPSGWRFFRKGAYIFAAVPYSTVPEGDYSNSYVKAEIRKILFAVPFFMEKGLFLLYYGRSSDWKPNAKLHRVDKTALRPIIIQSIHFVDPDTGENINSRTAWGPVQFGFCGEVIEKIEGYCSELAR